MAQTFTIPSTPLTVGETTFGPFSVPAGITAIEFHFPPRTLFNNTGVFQLLSQMWIDVSLDGGVTWRLESYGTPIFSDPNFTDVKRATTDCMTVWRPFPSPAQIRVRTEAVLAFTLAGASVVVT